jgi:hypothetical protein
MLENGEDVAASEGILAVVEVEADDGHGECEVEALSVGDGFDVPASFRHEVDDLYDNRGTRVVLLSW